MHIGSVPRALGPLVLALTLIVSSADPAAAHHALGGTLRGIHADRFGEGDSTTSWRLEQRGESVPVLPTGLPALAPERAEVEVRGVAQDGAVVGSVSSASPETAPPLGGRSLAVVLVNFAGVDERQPWTPAQVRERVFTADESASSFFREESHGELWLTGKSGNPEGDVYGWYTIDRGPSGCLWPGWASAAREAAAADGFDASDYQHVMYVFPRQSSCAWAGLAYLPGRESWINGDLGVRVTAHELGHNLGLHHAGGYRCTGAGGAPVTLSSSCTLDEYADPFDVMGSSGDRHNHAWHLGQLGLLQPSNVRTVTEPGSYTVRSALAPTAQATTLRIPRTRAQDGTVVDWYYLEVRESGGVFDDFAAGDFVVHGVSIRVTSDPSRTSVTRLLDANPANGGFANAPLAVGQTFRDGPLSVTTTQAGAGTATVLVSFTESPASDGQPPTAPANLRGVVVGGSVRLQWEPALDDAGVVRYAVHRDGVQVGTSGATVLDDLSVPPGAHVYTVYAEDAAANRSQASAPLAVRVSGPDPAPRGTGADDRDRTAPRLRLTRDRLRRDLVVLRAYARDNRRVARLELWIDGRRRGVRRGGRLRYRWNGRRERAGNHRVVARAVDASGNRASLSVRLRTRRR